MSLAPMTLVLIAAIAGAGDGRVRADGLRRTAQTTAQATPGPRQVAILYRGIDGRPRPEDLAVIQASGFATIFWPRSSEGQGDEVSRMAAAAGLVALLESDPGHMSPDALAIVDSGSSSKEELISAAAWRHVQRGARVIVFNPAASSVPGVYDRDGQFLPWVAPARALARQLSVNGPLFNALQPGPRISVLTGGADIDVTLLQTPRSWVLFATSLESVSRQVTAELPPGVPAALWTNVLDGTDMSMLNRPDGPLWTFEMPPFGVQVYVIEKS